MHASEALLGASQTHSGRFSVYYTTALEMIARLRQGLHRDTFDRRIRRYRRTKALSVDEIVYLPLDQDGANLFFQVVAPRYEKVATIFTSNKSIGEWGEVLGDPALATAALDRFLHHCVVGNMKGDSYCLMAGSPRLVIDLDGRA